MYDHYGVILTVTVSVRPRRTSSRWYTAIQGYAGLVGNQISPIEDFFVYSFNSSYICKRLSIVCIYDIF